MQSASTAARRARLSYSTATRQLLDSYSTATRQLLDSYLTGSTSKALTAPRQRLDGASTARQLDSQGSTRFIRVARRGLSLQSKCAALSSWRFHPAQGRVKPRAFRDILHLEVIDRCRRKVCAQRLVNVNAYEVKLEVLLLLPKYLISDAQQPKTGPQS